jgi:predicted acylesterase/phospholipase RssA
MAKKKVAIVLSGGISLGSYIAGALEELLAAFAHSQDYEIDIITGASAGATTAAIIAHGLLYRGGQTALEEVWLRKLDMVNLLEPDVPAGEPPTVLSAKSFPEVTRETLRWDNPADKGQRATYCASQLIVAMTLANSTALPYVSRVKQPTADGEESFIQYRYAEQETFLLSDLIPPTDIVWQRMGTVARASAAIPFVFPRVQLIRRADDDRQYIQRPSFQDEAAFWYYDGGTFNNLPIDLAWYYASQDPNTLDDRVIVVINPSRNTIPNVNTKPELPSLLEQVVGVFSALREESSTIQLENEVVRPSRMARNKAAGLPGLLPGVDQAPVDVLRNFALVMPGPMHNSTNRLRGNHLHALGAFLDERFREYDFRRGAADARRVALKRLNIPEYNSGREAKFYDPDSDGRINLDVSSYDKLKQIKSLHDSQRSVAQVFEDALHDRIDALLNAWNAPGPDFAFDPILRHFITNYARSKLPKLWLL